MVSLWTISHDSSIQFKPLPPACDLLGHTWEEGFPQQPSSWEESSTHQPNHPPTTPENNVEEMEHEGPPFFYTSLVEVDFGVSRFMARSMSETALKIYWDSETETNNTT